MNDVDPVRAAARRGIAARGAMLGIVAAAVASFLGAGLSLCWDDLGTPWSPSVFERLACMVTLGSVGLVYVGWVTVPIGAVVGVVVNVAIGPRLMTKSGRFTLMAIGAVAASAPWMFTGDVDAKMTAARFTVIPGAIGGYAAWRVARRMAHRQARRDGGDDGGGNGGPTANVEGEGAEGSR